MMKRTPISAFIALALLVTFFVNGCSLSREPKTKPGHPRPYKVLGKWYEPIPSAKGYTEKGKASWYGKDFHGKKTANGEIYNMYAMTAAHKTLPLGTWVRVENLENGKEIEVRINDRGPFVKGRIIDLSYAAAKNLGVVGPGTAPVKIVALGTPIPSAKGERAPRSYIPGNYDTGNFTIQVGAFTVRENAERMKSQMGKTYQNAHIVTYQAGGQVFYRVRVSKTDSLKQAKKFEAALVARGFTDAFVVAE